MRRAAVAIGLVVLLPACSGSTPRDRAAPKPRVSRSPARAGASIGWSIYDFDTAHSDAWPRLRAGS